MIDAVISKIERYIDDLENPLVTGYFNKLSRGKMLRTKLVNMIAGESETTITVAAIIEMIHLSSLLHDDVIDEADTRRGIPSINALLGNKHAIMLGDLLYSKAYFELVAFDKNIARELSGAVTKLSIGELLDVELANAFNDDESKYFEMIYLKTAALIEATTTASAMICGRDADVYRLAGKNLGIAYQVVDDILDITQDAAQLGKPSCSDLAEGKCTLPIIYLSRLLKGGERQKLMSLFKKELDDEARVWLRSAVVSSGALAMSQAYVKKIVDESKSVIADDGPLCVLFDQMVERSY